MAYTNIDLAFSVYADPTASRQPLVKLADVKWSILGQPTGKSQTIPFSLAPNESMTIASSVRPVSFTTAASFQVQAVDGGIMRITSTLGQRTTRSMGDNTTVFALSKTSDVMRLTSTSGTAPSWASISTGDLISFTTGWQVYNQNEFKILSKGANYIEFRNGIGLVETAVTGGLNVYTSGPVQKGDKVDISNPAFSFPNQGTFSVVAATDTYIDVLNPDVFPQTVTGISNGFSIYPNSYSWMLLAAEHKVIVGLNGDAPSSIQVEPYREGDINKQPGLFLKRGKVFEVRIYNPGSEIASGFLVLAE